LGGLLDQLQVRSGPTIVDPDVAILFPPELYKSISERRDPRLCLRAALGIRHQHLDPSHSIGLCARNERPSRRAADQRDERATFHLRDHSITSSARASRLGGTVRPSALAVV